MTVADSIETLKSSNQSQPTLGEMLAAARSAKKLTQQDVSNKLRFSVKQIDALENNAFDMLPDAMITRGFIRNYARLLEIDAEPLLASYQALVPAESVETLVVKSSMREVELTKESLPWLHYILGSILVLLFLLAWFFYVDRMPNSTTEKTSDVMVGDTTATEVSPLPEIALPAAQREDGIETATVAPGTNDVSMPPVPEESVSTNETAPDLSVKKVSMSFVEETWVRVTDQSGKVIYEKLQTAGSEDSFDATPPFDLVIGNAKATKLMFEGKPVDLATYTKGNVARVTLE